MVLKLQNYEILPDFDFFFWNDYFIWPILASCGDSYNMHCDCNGLVSLLMLQLSTSTPQEIKALKALVWHLSWEPMKGTNN